MHLIGGDLNFLARGDVPIRITTENSEIPLKGNDTRATNQSNLKWNAMLLNSHVFLMNKSFLYGSHKSGPPYILTKHGKT